MINKPIVLNIRLSYSQAITLMLQLKDKIATETNQPYSIGQPEPELKGFRKFKEEHDGTK